MNKEKQTKLTRYLNDMTNKLTSAIPAKHKKNPTTYKQFLEREIAAVKTTLDNAKLEGTNEKK